MIRDYLKKHWTFVCRVLPWVTLGVSTYAFALSDAQSFIYQGKMLDAAGTAPLLDTVDLTLSIYDPTDTCLLYEEKQTGINLNTTSGLFSVSIGSATGAAKRVAGVDPGNSMAVVFSNTVGSIPTGSATCGGHYTPSAGDVRYLRVTVFDETTSTTTTLTPDQTINAVPQATTAETIQGLTPANLLQTSVANNLSQVTAQTLTNGSDASALHNHNSLYAQIAGTPSFSNVTITGSPSAATDVCTKGYDDTHFDGSTLTVVAPTPGQSIEWNGTAWVNYTPPSGTVTSVTASAPLSVASPTAAAVISITQATSVSDGYLSHADWVNFNAKAPTASPNFTGQVGIGTTSASAALDVVGSIKIENGANSATLSAPASGGALTYTLPTSAGSNGNVLTTNGAGVLQWGASTDASKLPLAGGTMTGPIAMGGNNITGGGSITATTFNGALTGHASLDLPLAGGTMTGSVALGGNNITGGGSISATTFNGALTGHASLDLPLAGGTMTGPIALGGNNITGGGTVTGTTLTATTGFSGPGSNITALNASNIASGTVGTAYLGSGTANNTTYLRGDGTWTTPSSTDNTKVPLAGGTMTGELLIGASNATSALAVNQTNTGTAATFTGGYVGIGTTSPSAKLDVYNSAGYGTIDLGGLNGVSTPSSDSTAGGSIAIGASALSGQTTSAAYANTAVGYLAIGSGALTAAAQNNTAVGFEAMNKLTSGNANTALGSLAEKNITSGVNNNAIGNYAMWNVTSGSYNQALGDEALESIGTGGGNTAIGDEAMQNASGVSNNIAIGSNALINTAGSNNVAIGNGTAALANGSGNIYLGNSAGYNDTGSNHFFVNNVQESSLANDKAYSLLYGTFSGSAGSLTGQQLVINGNVGIGTTVPQAALDIVGQVRIEPSPLPPSPVPGEIAINSASSNALEYYNGTGWVTLGAAGNLTTDTFNDGNSGAPTINFAGDTTTGFYGNGSGTVGISSSGASVCTFNSSAESLAGGVSFTMNSGAGQFTQTFTGTTTSAMSVTANSVTTANAENLTANGLTTGNVLSLSSSSTAAPASGSNAGLNIAVSGANSNASVTRYGLESSVTATGATSTNVAGYFNATGATSNYGILVPNGNVGIGTATPSKALHVKGETFLELSSGTLTLSRTSPTVYTPSSNVANTPDGFESLSFQSGPNADGTMVTQEWRVNNTAGVNQKAYFGAVSVTGGGTQSPALVWGQQTSATSYNERMRIDSTGNVGIGTSSPASILDINGAQTLEEIGAASRPAAAAGKDFIYADGTSHTIKVSLNGAAYTDLLTSTGGSYLPLVGGAMTGNIDMQFNRFNNIGQANFNGGSNISNYGANMAIYGATSDSTSGIQFYSQGGGALMYIRDDGNVGIGTTNPGTRLTIGADSTPGLTIQTSGAGQWTGLRFAESGGAARLAVQKDSNNYLSFWTATGAAGSEAFAERMVMDTSGNVGIGTTSPAAELSLGAGSSTLAPLMLASGPVLSTALPGAIEYDGTNLFYTDNTSTRRTLATGSGSFLALSGGTLTGPVLYANGAVGAPSMSFSTDPTTGIYRGGAGTINFSSAGVSEVQINSSALQANVPIVAPTSGIGAGNPAYTFAGNTNTGIYSPAANEIAFSTGGTQAMMFNTTGEVGIGTSTPNAELSLGAGTNTKAPLNIAAGPTLSSTVPGAIEYDGTNLYFTDSTSARRTLATTTGLGNYLPLGGGTMTGPVALGGNNITGGGTITGTTLTATVGFSGPGSSITGLSASNVSSGTLPLTYGGTGQTSNLTAAGGVIYANTTTAMGSSAAGTAGQPLVSGGGGAPTFSNTITGSSSITIAAASGANNVNLQPGASGQVVSTSQIYANETGQSGSATVDFNTGNVQVLKNPGQAAITLNNMKSGAAYTVIISTDTANRTYTFTNCTTSKFVPANAQVSTWPVVYSILYINDATGGLPTTCLISWVNGFQ